MCKLADIQPFICCHADPDFQAFLALYEAGEESLPSAAAQREARERDKGAGSIATAPGPQTTHLLTYLQAKYAEGGRIGSARGARKGGRAGAGGADASGPMSLLKAPSRTKAKVRDAARKYLMSLCMSGTFT